MITEDHITFAKGTRDRADHLRGDAARIDRLWRAPGACILPLWRGKPLVSLDPPPTPDAPPNRAPALCWLSPGAPLLAEAKTPPAFLGLSGDDGCFALDVSPWTDPATAPGAQGFFDKTLNHHPSLPDHVRFAELRGVMADLSAQDAADAATAKGILEWHRSHRFCARCGQPSAMDGAGWRRKCDGCGALHFPRTDPVVIMLITHGDRVLLGRNAMWPAGMYSLLAGFMEPGETIEAAVRRETFEEAAITVGRVRYLASQPWPFPSSLMIGCAGEALDDAIDIDPKELEEAMWTPRAEIRAALAGEHPKILAARRGAIARTLLEAWIEDRAGAFA